MKYTKLFKLTALSTALIFAFETFLWAQPSIVYSYRLNAENGAIKQRFNAQNEKTVIVLEDAHSSFEAQKNISTIISEFALNRAQNGREAFIAVEGAAGEISLEAYRALNVPRARERVAFDYMRKGSFTGSEHAAISASQSMTLFGVEERALFIANYRDFVAIAETNNESLEFLNALQSELSALSLSLFNDELRAFDDAYQRFKKGESDLITFFLTLYAHSKSVSIDYNQYPFAKRLLEILETEGALSETKLKQEKNALIELIKKEGRMSASVTDDDLALYLYEKKLDRNEYRTFLTASDIRSLIGSLPLKDIVSEIDGLTRALLLTFTKTNDERALLNYRERLDSLVSILSLCAERNVTEKESQPEESRELNEILTFIKKIRSESERELTEPVALSSLVRHAETFYTGARARESKMVHNLLTEMEHRSIREALFVAGGFHTEGITCELKKRGINYLVVTPRISSDTLDLPYISKMIGELYPLSAELFGTIQALATYVSDHTLSENFTEEALAELFSLVLLEEMSPELFDSIRESLKIETSDATLSAFLLFARENLELFIDSLSLVSARPERSAIVAMMEDIAKRPSQKLSSAERDLAEFTYYLISELDRFYASTHDTGSFVNVEEGIHTIRDLILSSHNENPARPILVLITGVPNAGKTTLLDSLMGKNGYYADSVTHFGLPENVKFLGIKGDALAKYFNWKRHGLPDYIRQVSHYWYYQKVIDDPLLERDALLSQNKDQRLTYGRYLWRHYFNEILRELTEREGQEGRIIVFEQSEIDSLSDQFIFAAPREPVTIINAELVRSTEMGRALRVGSTVWTERRETLTEASQARKAPAVNATRAGGKWPFLSFIMDALPLSVRARDILQVVIEETFVIGGVSLVNACTTSSSLIAFSVLFFSALFYFLHSAHTFFPSLRQLPSANMAHAFIVTYMNFVLLVPFIIAPFIFGDVSFFEGSIIFIAANLSHYIFNHFAGLESDVSFNSRRYSPKLERRIFLKQMALTLPLFMSGEYYFKELMNHRRYLTASFLRGSEKREKSDYLNQAELTYIEGLEREKKQCGAFLNSMLNLTNVGRAEKEIWEKMVSALNVSDWLTAAQYYERFFGFGERQKKWSDRFWEIFSLTPEARHREGEVTVFIDNLSQMYGAYEMNGKRAEWFKWGRYPVVDEELFINAREGSFFYWADLYNNLNSPSAFAKSMKGKDIRLDLVNGHHWYLERYLRFARDEKVRARTAKKTVCIMFDAHSDLSVPVHDTGNVIDLIARDKNTLDAEAATASEISGFNLPLLYSGSVDELVWVVPEEARRLVTKRENAPYFVQFVPEDGHYRLYALRSRATGKLLIASEFDAIGFSDNYLTYAELQADRTKGDALRDYDMKEFSFHVVSMKKDGTTDYVAPRDDMAEDEEFRSLPDAADMIKIITKDARIVYSFDQDFFGTREAQKTNDEVHPAEKLQFLTARFKRFFGDYSGIEKKALLPDYALDDMRYAELLYQVKRIFELAEPEHIVIARSPNFSRESRALSDLFNLFNVSPSDARQPEWLKTLDRDAYFALKGEKENSLSNDVVEAVVTLGVASGVRERESAAPRYDWSQEALRTLNTITEEIEGRDFNHFIERVRDLPGHGVIYITEGLREEMERDTALIRSMLPHLAERFGVEFIVARRAEEQGEKVLFDGLSLRLGTYHDALMRVKEKDTTASSRNVLVLARENEGYSDEILVAPAIFEFSFSDATRRATEFSILAFILVTFFESVKKGELLTSPLFNPKDERGNVFLLAHDIMTEKIVSELLRKKIEMQFKIAA
jgi:hypothetical protein